MLRIIAVLGMLFLTAGSASAQYAGLTPCGQASRAVTTSTANVALPTCGPTVILYNTSSQEAYYNIGSSSTITATTSSYYIPGGGFVVLQQPTGLTSSTQWYLAAITPTSTSTFKVVVGAAKP